MAAPLLVSSFARSDELYDEQAPRVSLRVQPLPFPASLFQETAAASGDADGEAFGANGLSAVTSAEPPSLETAAAAAVGSGYVCSASIYLARRAVLAFARFVLRAEYTDAVTPAAA